MTEPLSVLAAAIAPGSSREQRAAAADVCRMLIAALEAQEGQPLPISTAEAQPGEPLPPAAPAEPTAPAVPPALASAPDVRQPAAEAPNTEPQPEPDSRSRRTVPMPAAVPLRPPHVPPAFPIDPQAVASLIDAARTLPTETMLDLAISHVRSLVQAKGQPVPQASAPVRFHLVPLPPSSSGPQR